MSKPTSRYSVLIQWSDEDQLYIASLPEWGPYARTHGKTYEKAARAAREVLESLVATYQEEQRPLPEPHTFLFPGEPAEQQPAREQQEAQR
jgi:predicted RNase H-like HicB family nuclease